MITPDQAQEEALFEEWMSDKLTLLKQNKILRQSQQSEVITIPVVVHIIHNGESLGSGRNIPDGQIISQIDVLNEDYRRTNADASNTPTVFQSVAADTEIQFALAQRDPEGLPTNGIVRVNGAQASWLVGENYALKNLSYWPAEDYLNIWVTDLGDNYLGYAQFPDSGLSGLENSSINRETDGVVIDYMAFGSIEKFPSASLDSKYNLGRSTTHEVGHYLGLRHIWGDIGGCSGTDYVDDTPTQESSTTTCPESENRTSCSSQDMFQNYMDYTDDACMNIFTEGQKGRIQVVMDNSPRRASLKSSKGNIAPVTVSNNLGVRQIYSPKVADCADNVIPTIEIRNYGNNSVTSAQIQLLVNGSPIETISYSGSLAPLAATDIEFSTYTYPSSGAYNFTFDIIEVNNGTDQDDSNNSADRLVTVPEEVDYPINITFDNFPTNWSIENPDGFITWNITTAPKETSNNKALGVNFSIYENGEHDIFKSGMIDLTDVKVAVLQFDVAYESYFSALKEGLLVTVNPYCGDAIDNSDTLFYETGVDLSTTKRSSSFFVPADEDDWETIVLDMEQYIGQKVSIAFVGINGYGNNLYLDNIQFETKEKTDAAITKIISPSVASCTVSDSLRFVVTNKGTKAIGSMQINISFDGVSQTLQWQKDPADSLKAGEQETISLALPNYSEGEHSLEIALINPNLSIDHNPDNNLASLNLFVNSNSQEIPIKENFEDFYNSSLWLISNPDNSITWDTVTLDYSTALRLKTSEYDDNGEQDLLISPVLDFGSYNTAILSFDVASASNENSLSILASYDCGENYDYVIYNSDDITSGNFSGVPAATDWKTIDMNLFSFLGTDQTRLAFVATNNEGSDLFIDNINIYVTEQYLKAKNPYPNPNSGLLHIPFNLDSKETVEIVFYNTSGKILAETSYPNTLNQTYSYDMSHLPSGIYLLKMKGESFTEVKRIMVNH
ncbi:M43 family zinc metalloprotease [Fulvivirga ligni]|uniref:M43 family zinc metalloprotease n=1 Tax=Fulvivirga ligni TaxID=2904246 RepID=UPI001EEE0C03|nr:M43 family zinc metalloprotease [Fulvivirga ligni]UII23730.1 T9SS type A sorting domain-containing protein [Fulvivirga ligni]